MADQKQFNSNPSQLNQAGRDINVTRDMSQANVLNASGYQVNVSGGRVYQAENINIHSPERIQISIDKELDNLLKWLAQQQGISKEVALKKAVATAAYIHDLRIIQRSKILVQRPDDSIGELVIK